MFDVLLCAPFILLATVTKTTKRRDHNGGDPTNKRRENGKKNDKSKYLPFLPSFIIIIIISLTF